MIVLFPAFLVLHILGVVLWLGGSMVQYIFFTDMPKQADDDSLPFYLDLIKKINTSMIHSGMILVLLSGLIMILAQGMEWLRSHGFIHIKIALGLLATVLAVLAFFKIRKSIKLLASAERSNEIHTEIMRHLDLWKIYILTILIILGVTVTVGVFKF